MWIMICILLQKDFCRNQNLSNLLMVSIGWHGACSSLLIIFSNSSYRTRLSKILLRHFVQPQSNQVTIVISEHSNPRSRSMVLSWLLRKSFFYHCLKWTIDVHWQSERELIKYCSSLHSRKHHGYTQIDWSFGKLKKSQQIQIEIFLRVFNDLVVENELVFHWTLGEQKRER